MELNKVDFASDELREKLQEKLLSLPKEDQYYIAFAYTDYGGDFLDYLFIEYFKEEYPDNILTEKTMYFGQNGIVFGKIAKECFDVSQNYLLGFEQIEEYYSEKQIEIEAAAFQDFIKDEYNDEDEEIKERIINLLIEERSGYYSILSSQTLDFCWSELKTFVDNNIRKVETV